MGSRNVGMPFIGVEAVTKGMPVSGATQSLAPAARKGRVDNLGENAEADSAARFCRRSIFH